MPGCLKPLLDLLGYPATAISALSNGSLRSRYCTYLFAKKFTPWSLSSGDGSGHLSHLIAQGGSMGHHSLSEEVNDGPKVVRRRIRGKTPRHEVLER